MSYFVISKIKLDFEGYPKRSEVIGVEQTLEQANKKIETLLKPILCKCGGHTDFSYDVKEIKK